MSLQYSDTVTRRGIIQTIEKNCGFNPGDITNNTTLLQDFTADVNLALDKALAIVIPASGKWHIDDSNFTDYPEITHDLNANQRDYSFTADGSGNIILDVYRVMVADQSGVFHEIYPVDQQATTKKQGNAEDTGSFIDGLNASGVPTRYAKTANGIFLDVIPNYTIIGGLKVFIDREPSYFTVNDTTKKPGFAGIFHEYLALRPSFQYAYRNGFNSVKALQSEMLTMERDMLNYYSQRDKDTPKRLIANVENNK